MTDQLTDFDKSLLREIAEGLPIVSRPFAKTAEKLGVSEEEVAERLRSLRDSGIIRRWGARVNHYAVGRTENCMIVWEAPADEVKALGEKLARHPAVSHCYQRDGLPGFPYTLYTMVHARSKEELDAFVDELKALAGVPCVLLHSMREYKKSTPRYFGEATQDAT
jgi:DNA-binding Lrp family transcriptional regulator